MPRFSYIALDVRGAEKSGLLDAPDVKQVAAILKGQGLFPTDVIPQRGEAVAAVTKSSPALRPVPSSVVRPLSSVQLRLPFLRMIGAKELAVFTRQLATLLRAGMPLLRGLEVLARQERNQGFRHVIEALAEAIKSGGTLSEAMTQHPRVFGRLYVNMVKAGEAGGVLDVVLGRLARFQEKSLQLKGKITSAMVYPLIVMAVAVLILAGLLVFVVPKFQQIFADLLKGAPLPPLTQFVLTVSDAVKNHSIVALGVGIALWFAAQAFRRTPAGARLLDTWTLQLPLFGQLFLKAIVARFGRTLGTLLSSGVPILPALLITRDTCGNTRIAGAITEVHDRVKEGAPVARPLESTQVFPPMVTSMIDVGEHTGQLPEMLGKVADIYEDEVDNAVAGLSSLIEPILILFLALVVGTIVIALFLPIIRIVQLLT
ncbi:type II secretion system F family protein [Opitutus sp. GAS368]|uniref:type II secretion system F family protein n=1 Tax=Opitutus sp. GAS368 TaxID=1882749 RepID=UPI00087D673B|nr:type II secretion system F family protein [Opitutus sp. GAS368]SDS61672.1 type IV pilus assembly protein PilC [Opitutus sp. GAS368]